MYRLYSYIHILANLVHLVLWGHGNIKETEKLLLLLIKHIYSYQVFITFPKIAERYLICLMVIHRCFEDCVRSLCKC